MCSLGARLNFRNVALQQPALRRIINKERSTPLGSVKAVGAQPKDGSRRPPASWRWPRTPVPAPPSRLLPGGSLGRPRVLLKKKMKNSFSCTVFCWRLSQCAGIADSAEAKNATGQRYSAQGTGERRHSASQRNCRPSICECAWRTTLNVVESGDEEGERARSCRHSWTARPSALGRVCACASGKPLHGYIRFERHRPQRRRQLHA